MLKQQKAEWKAILKLEGSERSGGNILHFAAEQGYVLLAADAFRKGVDPHSVNVTNADGMSPLRLAVAHNLEPMVGLLVRNGAEIKIGSSTALHQAVEEVNPG